VWAKDYPWEFKTSKAYWRGGCSDGGRGHRKIMLALADAAMKTNLSKYLDVHHVSHDKKRCPRNVKPAAAGKSPMEESMRFKAVIDIDGNSWSERFPRLMCYNSAVIRIDVSNHAPTLTDFEEYYMMAGDKPLPGVHYIPADLNNFTRVAASVMTSGDDYLQTIVKNANSWCLRRLDKDSMYKDLLSSINGYVEQLYVGDANWVEEWKKEQDYFIGNETDIGFTDIGTVKLRRTKRMRRTQRMLNSLPRATLHLSRNSST
jgi:hypothetical protein